MTYFNGSVHGKQCNSKTIPMQCKHCKQKVFYFTCDCGSKVFFEELGEPWPIHDCSNDCQIVSLQITIPKGYLLDGLPNNAIKLRFEDMKGDVLVHGYTIKLKKL